MRILIADKFPQRHIEALEKLGHEVALKAEISAEELPNHIKGCECLVVRNKKVTAQTIDASDALSLIVRAGTSVNTIDIEAAAKRAVFVTNTPVKNSVAIAELAFGLMLSIDRRIPDNVIDLKNSIWNKEKYSQAQGLYGKTLGVVGMGEVGMAIADRAEAFGMNVIAFDPIALMHKPVSIIEKLEKRIFVFCNTIEELAKNADIISFHLPSNPHTKKTVNREFLRNVKENAIIINTSRGDIIDDEALIEAMNAKNIRAGLDVFNGEPSEGIGNFETALSKHPNVYGTHHIGASTEQAKEAIAEEVVEIIRNYDIGAVMNPVNIEIKPITKHVLIARVYDKVGVLASILNLLKEQGVSIQQMDSKVFNGEIAQQIMLYLNKCPDKVCIDAISQMPDIIQVKLKTIISEE